MLDRERILGRLATLEGYLKELQAIAPESFDAFRRIEKKRACERILQISIEAVIDLCHLFVTGLKLGLPAEEDLFEKLALAGGDLAVDEGDAEADERFQKYSGA